MPHHVSNSRSIIHRHYAAMGGFILIRTAWQCLLGGCVPRIISARLRGFCYPLLTGYCMESQIGYIQIQIHLWVTSRIPKLASRIPDCHFPEKKQSLEHARILSEGFQNPEICFQNPKLSFFKKKRQPWTRPDSIGELPEFQGWLPSMFPEKKTGLSLPRFYRRAYRITDCHLPEKKLPWACPDSIGRLPDTIFCPNPTKYPLVPNNRVQCNNRMPRTVWPPIFDIVYNRILYWYCEFGKPRLTLNKLV